MNLLLIGTLWLASVFAVLFILRRRDPIFRQDREFLDPETSAPTPVTAPRPITVQCCGCQKIRMNDLWVERTTQPSEPQPEAPRERVSHGICPDCLKARYGEFLTAGVPEDWVK